MHRAEVQDSKKAQGKDHTSSIPDSQHRDGGEGLYQWHPSSFGTNLPGPWERGHSSAGSSPCSPKSYNRVKKKKKKNKAANIEVLTRGV